MMKLTSALNDYSFNNSERKVVETDQEKSSASMQ